MVRNPTKLADLANDSSDDDDDESNPPGLASTALFCLRVAKYDDSEESLESTSFEHTFATRSQIDSDEWKSRVQRIIDAAMESELDQLMIFADGGEAPRRKSVLNTIASKARKVLSRGRKGGVSFVFLRFFIVVDSECIKKIVV